MSAICDAYKKKVDVKLLYNSVHRKFNQLKTRCSWESQHPAEGILRPPIKQLGFRPVGEKRLDWGICPRWAGRQAPGWAAQENGKETRLWTIELVGVNMLQFCSVYNSLSHTTLSNKELCRSSLLCHRYDFACICRCICIMCLYSWSCLYNK